MPLSLGERARVWGILDNLADIIWRSAHAEDDADAMALNALRIKEAAALKSCDVVLVKEAINVAKKAAHKAVSEQRRVFDTLDGSHVLKVEELVEAEDAVCDSYSEDDPCDVLLVLAVSSFAFRHASTEIMYMYSEVRRQIEIDADCVAYPQGEYFVDLGNGFDAHFGLHDAWDFFMRFPAGHFAIKLHPLNPKEPVSVNNPVGVLNLTDNSNELVDSLLEGRRIHYHRDRTIGLNNSRLMSPEYSCKQFISFDLAMKQAIELKELFRKMCATCGKKTTMCCSRCDVLAYCNEECQRADWAAHKLICHK